MDEWESWVGRTWQAEAHLDPAQANRMAATLDREPTFRDGDPLPPAWHWLYFHDIVRASQLGRDGHPRLGVTMPPVPLPRRMWASGSLRFGAHLPLGSTCTRTSTVTAITPKEGRSGRLCFVTVTHDILRDGRTHVSEVQTIVYRDLVAAEAAAPSAPAPPELTRRWDLDSTALFRYSALTFNGHRIHYDIDYARDVAGYPGLVIHGPLLATLLADLAQAAGGRLCGFAYRARSPLFAPEAFTVNGHRTDAGTQLWAASLDGRLAMDATATYRSG